MTVTICERCKKEKATHRLHIKDSKGERDLHLCAGCTDHVILMETGNIKHTPHWKKKLHVVEHSRLDDDGLEFVGGYPKHTKE